MVKETLTILVPATPVITAPMGLGPRCLLMVKLVTSAHQGHTAQFKRKLPKNVLLERFPITQVG